MRPRKSNVNLYGLKEALRHLPTRHLSDNKIRDCKTLIVVGSYGTWGAAVLCAKASARIGAGYTYVLDAKKDFPNWQHPDFLMTDKFKNLSNFNSIALDTGYKDKISLKK